MASNINRRSYILAETRELYLTDTLTREKKRFEPASPPFVTIYHCGITPYDYSHIGHLRAEVAVDLLRRTLRAIGYYDIAVSNFTDIDDKIIRRSKEEKVDWREIPKKFIKYHLKVTRAINNLPFYVYPRVTKHIDDIISFIQTLLDKGYAYIGKTGVYFQVDKYPYYGQLSGRTNKDLWEQETDVLADKKAPYDFALWKFKKEGEPFWRAPFGNGRPGWHIECSVMSTKYLGAPIDIHSGGMDIVFPHHENEIAQSEAALNVRPWVRYWFHVGLVKLKGEKMSKSLGNIIRAGDLIEEVGAMPLRYYLLSSYYRHPLSVSHDAIISKRNEYSRITNTIKKLMVIFGELEPSYNLTSEQKETFYTIASARNEFIQQMLDDLNTPEANAVINRITTLINKDVLSKTNYTLVLAALDFYSTVNKFYGVWDDVFGGKKKKDITANLIRLLLDVRNKLRENKYYELSDIIREELKKIGIVVEDEENKSTWRESDLL